MEAITTVSFHCSAEDAPQWQVILAGLARQEWGAKLQERFDYFGSEAAEKLESILDEYDSVYWNCESWKQIGNGFEFQLYSGIEAEEFAQSLEALLALCRASDIAVDVHYDDDEC